MTVTRCIVGLLNSKNVKLINCGMYKSASVRAFRICFHSKDVNGKLILSEIPAVCRQSQIHKSTQVISNADQQLRRDENKTEFKDFSLSKDVLLPELNDTELFPPSEKVREKKSRVADRFVDAAIEHSQRGITENFAATFLSSGDARIDFFCRVLEDTDESATISLLENSWNHNRLDTLRMIAYLRDIRSGKGIRHQYYACLYWIYQHHPRTLLQNIHILIDCGYWKDPLQLLMIILFKGKIPDYLLREGQRDESRRALINIMKKRHGSGLGRKNIAGITRRFYEKINLEMNETLVAYYKNDVNAKYKPLVEKVYCRESGEYEEIVRERKVHEVDSKYMKELIVRYARERFNDDIKYRQFHLKFAEIIAKQLIADLGHLKSKNLQDISLAAKWAPSLCGHFDKYTLIGSSIALQIAKLTREQDPAVEHIFTKPIPIATYLARKNYQKNYIVCLREQLKIPERYMCSNQWNILPYKHVPSKCMQNNRQIFLKHDHDRFEQFIKSQTKIAGGTLTPVELVKRSMDCPISLLEIELLEKQWNSLKDSIQINDKETCFKSALCVCDVSGSMTGTPMEAAIGLTLMTMSFTSEPWCNICLTFSHNPQIVHLEGYRSFFDDVCQLRKADWGCNTDLTKTFELILQIAKKNDLKQNDMPQSLFIFTDMEFDQACNPNETNYEEAKRLFAESGYKLPTIIFWNLRSSASIPVRQDERGTILLSGYSAQQLSLMLNSDLSAITPLSFLEKALSMEKYKELVVVD